MRCSIAAQPVNAKCHGRSFVYLFLAFLGIAASEFLAAAERPNLLFILTDDQRWDALGCVSPDRLETPHLDQLAARGTRFSNAFVVLSICSPSRAACLTGCYGSVNGVTRVGNVSIRPALATFPQVLNDLGYRTGVTGKWHLGTSPAECGFQFASICRSNGTWYDRAFILDGSKEPKPVDGFVEDVIADESIRFMEQTVSSGEPFCLWLCTQVPHMDHRHEWPVAREYLDRHRPDQYTVPPTWDDDLEGKPSYLNSSRSRTQALSYGYDRPEAIQEHARQYYASVEQLDAALGRVFDSLDRLGIRDNTWIVVMGDNGWMLGEHGFTSKVLPYEESIRVPLIIAGPDTQARVEERLALNVDVPATLLDLAGAELPAYWQGQSLLPLVTGEAAENWRRSFLYEAPDSQLGSRPLWAVRTGRWKYIETQVDEAEDPFVELYDLEDDPLETTNLAQLPAQRTRVAELAGELRQLKEEFITTAQVASEPEVRRDLFISGIYPHLTTYGVYSQNGAHYKQGHDECGIGAVVPWAGRLWMVNYAPHQPRGSEHKLFSVDEQMNLTIHPESVGGTPAGRMIHRESNQLLIGPYVIDKDRNIRVISPQVMPGRLTGIARHLIHPEDWVYYYDMEGALYEVNVHDLQVRKLFQRPVPGWHGKGAYTSQGRLVIANNGERSPGNDPPSLVGGPPQHEDEAGMLAEWDGDRWQIVERKQYTDVTGPGGILGAPDDSTPLWAIGWDRRSLRLKLLDGGQWYTFLLPKAAHCNDPKHGWYTEWPRIRQVGRGRVMMDMHGMFFDFPKTFSRADTAGLAPIASHLRYIPDFCDWNGRLVLASDETSIQGNPLAGQPQSNLWFGSLDDLKRWGPASAYGGPWVVDRVKANTPSSPFLVHGFDRCVLHLALGGRRQPAGQSFGFRAADEQTIHQLSPLLRQLPRVAIRRGDWHKPAPGFSFKVDRPVTVYLAVDQRGEPKLGPHWTATNLTVVWGDQHRDRVYRRDFESGSIEVPPNLTEHTPNAFGMPHLAFVAARAQPLTIEADTNVTVVRPEPEDDSKPRSDGPVRFTIEIDRRGRGRWEPYQTIEVPAGGYVYHVFPTGWDAQWVRLRTDKDCVATAYFHLTDQDYQDGQLEDNRKLFAGLGGASDSTVHEARVYAAKRNRNLRVVAADGRFFEFEKATFAFRPDRKDGKLADLLEVEQEFTVDGASVVIEARSGRLRLPKGDAAYDQPFSSGWPRATREVESERHLANIHGTFYEVPLIRNGQLPAFELMRPVSSHGKHITDYCSWNGLLVLAGVRRDAAEDGHVFTCGEMALWFGGVDDLWRFGKPTGVGGPWRETPVQANEPSDPYLMTGFDQKELTLKTDRDAVITIEVDIDHQSGWHAYREVAVSAGQPWKHTFPNGFSAHWIRFRSDTDCKATAWLVYE